MAGTLKTSQFNAATVANPTDEVPLLQGGQLKRVQVSVLTGNPDAGWIATGESWTFSSFNSATRIGVVIVPSNATTKYVQGMKVRFSQATGGTKYGVIVAVTTTTLAIFFLSGITLNNEAILTPNYSMSYMPTGYTGAVLTKEAYQSDVTNSERWVYEMSGWGFMVNQAAAAMTEVVQYGFTYAAIPIVLVTCAADNNTGGTYGSGDNTIEGRIFIKAGPITTSQFNVWLHQGAGANFADAGTGRTFYTWQAKGAVS